MNSRLLMLAPPVSQSPLGRWIAENRPDLDKELQGLPLKQALAVLNREAGLQVAGNATIESTLPLFLEALKKKHGG